MAGGRLRGDGFARMWGARCVQWGARVSLADRLALQTRIRGFENPRLLRDRPSDGAALAGENACGGVHRWLW